MLCLKASWSLETGNRYTGLDRQGQGRVRVRGKEGFS